MNEGRVVICLYWKIVGSNEVKDLKSDTLFTDFISSREGVANSILELRIDLLIEIVEALSLYDNRAKCFWEGLSKVLPIQVR